ncbi:MAG: TRAP transporter large permease [Bacillota bacterium]
MPMIYLLAGLLAFALIGVPLAFSIGASSIAYMLAETPKLLQMLPQKVWSGAFSELMIALPLFILAGELMNGGGITHRIIRFCRQMLRPVSGGMGEINVVASMIFGGISGSSVADTSALGSIEIPAMEKEGYPSGIAAGLTVATSTMGMIIPPSTPMIVFAMISGGSVGGLFLAGAIPGLMIGITQLILIYVKSVRHGWHPKKTPFVWKEFWRDIVLGIPALLMPVAIVLSVSFGVCTASESAGIAVLYALLIGFLVYRELTWKLVWKALQKTFLASSAVMLIIGFTYIFTFILTLQKVPQTIQLFFFDLNLPKWAVLLIFDVFILFIGTFIDVSPAILLLTPILLPVMHSYGVSVLQFGAMMITGMAIGLVTPPVGMCLNACNKINHMPVMDIFRGALPFIACNVLVLVIISLWEPFTLWLPGLLGF